LEKNHPGIFEERHFLLRQALLLYWASGPFSIILTPHRATDGCLSVCICCVAGSCCCTTAASALTCLSNKFTPSHQLPFR